jgi:hypothetical protein
MGTFIKLFREKNIYLILLFYTLYYVLTLITAYTILEDEAWYANAAYSFSQCEWVNTKLIGGGLPNFIYPVFEGIIFKLLGFSFLNARLTSFLFGFFSIIIFRSILKLLNIKNHIIFIILLLFIFSPGYFHTFHIARPESAAVFFSLVSILYFLKSKRNEKHEKINICLCSFFSGIAFLSHPFTFPIYLIFGGYYLIHFFKQKKLLNVFYFSIIAILIFFLFIINSYIVFGKNFEVILNRTSGNNSIIYNSGHFFVNFLSIRMLSKNGLLLITFAILPGLILWKNITLRFISFTTIMYLIIASFIFSSSHVGNYLMLNYIGLFSIFSIAILVNIYDKKIILLICIFYIITYSILNIKKNHNNNISVHDEINLLLNSKIPSGAKVYGDMRFWFLLPKTNFTAIYFNRYKKSLNETISESDWILVCNDFAYNNVTNFYQILQSAHDMNVRLDTVLNIPTKQYGVIMVYKIYK